MSAPRAKPAAVAPAPGLLTEVYVTVSVEMKKVTKRSKTMKAVKALTKVWNKAGKEVAFTGACMDGQFIAANKIEPLENLPTKIDLITKIAVGIKQVPTKLARGTKGNANKLGYAAKAIAEGKSDLIQA